MSTRLCTCMRSRRSTRNLRIAYPSGGCRLACRSSTPWSRRTACPGGAPSAVSCPVTVSDDPYIGELSTPRPPRSTKTQQRIARLRELGGVAGHVEHLPRAQPDRGQRLARPGNRPCEHVGRPAMRVASSAFRRRWAPRRGTRAGTRDGDHRRTSAALRRSVEAGRYCARIAAAYRPTVAASCRPAPGQAEDCSSHSVLRQRFQVGFGGAKKIETGTDFGSRPARSRCWRSAGMRSNGS